MPKKEDKKATDEVKPKKDKKEKKESKDGEKKEKKEKKEKDPADKKEKKEKCAFRLDAQCDKLFHSFCTGSFLVSNAAHSNLCHLLPGKAKTRHQAPRLLELAHRAK